MKNTIASLAFLKVNWDTKAQQKDYLDIFIPFIATLIKKRNYIQINVHEVRQDFEEEYGLRIPYHPLLAILNRAVKNKFIEKKRDGIYRPIFKAISAADFTESSLEQERKHNNIIARFIDFCLFGHKITISATEAEDALISFLKDHDLDILFISQDFSSILPDVSTSAEQKHLINSFVRNTHESDNETFSYIVDISIGHIVANALLNKDYNRYQGDLSKCNLYLDVGILFNIMGINGEEKKEAYLEFVNHLNSIGVNLYVFTHTSDEFHGILESCKAWVESPIFDPIRASRASIYFVENRYSSSDVDLFILKYYKELRKLKIHVVNIPAPRENEYYQIAEEELSKKIIDIYRGRDPFFDQYEKEYTINKDIKSISAIYKLREGYKPKYMHEAKEIFVTTNSSLALASKLFETAEDAGLFFIPATLTDVFIGTLIWMQSSTLMTKINEKRLIANCYAALQPAKNLVKKMVDSAEKLRNDGDITDEDLILLKQSHVARNLLQEETLGNPNRFTDKTTIEILGEVRAAIRNEEKEIFREEKEKYLLAADDLKNEIKQAKEEVQRLVQKDEVREAELKILHEEKLSIERNIEIKSKKISKNVVRVFYLITTIVVFFVLLFDKYPQYVENYPIMKNIFLLTAVFLAFSSAMNGFNVFGIGSIIERRITRGITEYLSKR